MLRTLWRDSPIEDPGDDHRRHETGKQDVIPSALNAQGLLVTLLLLLDHLGHRVEAPIHFGAVSLYEIDHSL